MARKAKVPVMIPTEGPLTLAEIESRLLLPKGSLEAEGIPAAYTMTRYDPDGVSHEPADPAYRSNPDFVPEVEETYLMNPKQVASVLIAFDTGVPVQTFGVSGSGKTTFWEQFAGRLGRELRIIQCLRGMTERILLGKQDFASDENGTRTGFSLGPLPTYIAFPGAIVLMDETDNLDDAIQFIMQPLLKRNGVLRISELGDNGNFYPAQDVMIAATSNTINGVDETGMYTRAQQDFSQVDRYLCKIPFPPPDEKKILTSKFKRLAPETVEALVTFAKKFRETPELQSHPLSTRRLVYIGEVTEKYGSSELALEHALFNELTPLLAASARNLAVHLSLCKPGLIG